MNIKVAINCFGRMGRLTLRALIDSSENLEIVHVNRMINLADKAAKAL